MRHDLAPEQFSFVLLSSPETLSLHREEEWRKRGGLYGETVRVDTCGAVLCTHEYVSQWILYSICFLTGSQCSDCRTGVM